MLYFCTSVVRVLLIFSSLKRFQGTLQDWPVCGSWGSELERPMPHYGSETRSEELEEEEFTSTAIGK